MDKWFYAKGRNIISVSLQELRNLIKSGAIKADADVLKENASGYGMWRSAREFDELADLFAT